MLSVESCRTETTDLSTDCVADYGFADVGYHAKMYGHNLNPVKTPNLDALSATGIRLENYYIQPVCSPTRATLLT